MFRSKHARTIKRIRKIHMKVVTIGGGTGQFTLLSAIRDLELDITAIVSMVDSGGSTGRLRDELGVLPPGDILKCLIALSPYKDARKILQSRFKYSEKLRNHNAGNMLIVFLSEYLHGNFPEAVEAMGEIMNVKGTVLPVMTSKATLVAELENGELIYGESNIDLVRSSKRSKIKKTFLVPHSGNLNVYPPAVEEIMNADYVLIGPGDLYTSLTPNFLLTEIKQAIRNTSANIVYIVNVMTKSGETDGFQASDFVRVIEDYLGRKVEIVVVNNARPAEDILKKYQEEGAFLVNNDLDMVNNHEINSDTSGHGERKIIARNLITEQMLARHDIEKLKNVITEIL